MLLLALAGLLGGAQEAASESWRAWLVTPGGELPFGLELAKEDGGWRAELVNEPERIPIVVERWDGSELALAIPPYESRITARLERTELVGTWTKRRSATSVAEVPFHARAGEFDRFPRKATATPPARLAGRWAVDFESDELPAVAVFEQVERERELSGTFLTATGDHRYLAGAVDGDELALSCFDGAHAFLYHARLQPDGTLAGDFWSGNWHHERWTARRDDSAALPDAFAQTHWQERASLADLVFSDLAGNPRCLAEPEFAGKATLLVVFGSWCPNCNDEAKLLVELDQKYRARGLAILGLAFELTGDFAEDSAALRGFAERHGITYPLFLAGTADKGAATEALAALDRVRAYPTTIFLAGDGSVRAVHTGYAGPATGEEHVALRKEFEQRIEALLAEEPPREDDTWRELSASPWTFFSDDPHAIAEGDWAFVVGEDDLRRARWKDHDQTVVIRGRSVSIGSWTLEFDPKAGVLVDSMHFGRRFFPAHGPAAPLLASEGSTKEEDAVRSLKSADPLVRREALFALAEIRRSSEARIPEAVALLDDPDLEVRIAAAWALGRTRDDSARERLRSSFEAPNLRLKCESASAYARLAKTDPEVQALIELAFEYRTRDPILSRALLADVVD